MMSNPRADKQDKSLESSNDDAAVIFDSLGMPIFRYQRSETSVPTARAQGTRTRARTSAPLLPSKILDEDGNEHDLHKTLRASRRDNVESDTDLDLLFFLSTLSIHLDKEFMWICGKALITFSYTPEGISLDRLWVPVRYRHNHVGKRSLRKFLRFFRSRNIPVFLTVAPLDKQTDAQKLIQFYTSVGFRPTGFINALKLPEMIYGDPVQKPKKTKPKTRKR